ncbi:MAG: glycoside hydrolase family 5 protein [Clostridiales bacterium]|nr:glycoside hydrolase family 5 protein [Clostridiales bacterium]
MNRLDGYMAGCNLGHWISQYGRKGAEHHSTYITAPDFTRMASWGIDHVRLPVDYSLFERDEEPGVYREEGLAYIDSAIRWAKEAGLNLVLDLHHAPGFFFGNGAKNDLFTSPASRKRFEDIWVFFARRYAGEGDNLRFELLNELVWDDSGPWNELWQDTAARIHAITPERKIIVGPNRWNSVFELKNLAVSPNPNILYTFHMYEPFLFTHQRASWVEQNRNYLKPVTYPFSFDDHRTYYGDSVPYGMERGGMVDRDYLEKILQPAVEFIEKNDRPLYLGEYGVIANADVDSMVNWYRDVADLCLAHGIGRAVWSYRGFAKVTDDNNEIVDGRIIEAIARK